MKIIKECKIILAAVFMMMMLTQCGNDDDALKGSIIGTWQGESVEAKAVALGIPVWQDSDDDFNSTLEFNANGTVIVSDNGQEEEGTWEKEGKTLYMNVDLNYEGFSSDQELKIKKLTETDLQLYIEKDSTFKDPDSGIEIEATLKATAYFKRIAD